MYINDRIPEERNEIVLKHTFEEEDENEEEVMGISFSLSTFLSFHEFFLLSCNENLCNSHSYHVQIEFICISKL